MRIKNIKEIDPVESNCISVDSPDKLFAVGEKGSLMTHNSVSQQNIIISCLLRPKNWVILGIDLKRVELTRFKKFGVKVATDIETSVEFLRFAQAVMMKRYERMEETGVNDFTDLPEPLQALMIMIDEAGELLSPTGAKALSENTSILTPNGSKPLKSVKIGDTLLDNYGKPTKVTNKYIPKKQKKYELSISSDTSKKSEQFIAGEEHYWVVYFKNNEGNLDGPHTLETYKLHEIIKREKRKPLNERIEIKIKRRFDHEEWFTIDNIKQVESTDKLYCISVDSPECQFQIGEMGVPTHNTDEAKEVDELKGEAIMIIGSIARLGRAAGVHLVIATQRPDAKLIPGEVRDNLAVRVGCGRLKPSASLMMFDSNIGQRIHANPKGGMYVQIHGAGNMGQGFFAPNDWLEKYYDKHGLFEQAKPAKVVADLDDTMKKADKPFVEYWDNDMEEIHEAKSED